MMPPPRWASAIFGGAQEGTAFDVLPLLAPFRTSLAALSSTLTLSPSSCPPPPFSRTLRTSIRARSVYDALALTALFPDAAAGLAVTFATVRTHAA